MPETQPAAPGILVPPPVVYALGFLLGICLELVAPTPDPPPLVAGAVGLLGIVAWALLDPGAMRDFGRAETAVSPSRPATALVTAGPYRWTRNPMYLGMALLHAALAVAFGVLWALAALVVVLAVIDRGVVPREERHLAATFGSAYTDYRARVRRWF